MIRLRTRIGAASAAAMFSTVMFGAPAAAVTPITFNIYVNGTCQYGTGMANTSFTVRLLDSNGDLVQRKTTMSDGTGYWYSCFAVPGSVGFKVRATGGGADRTVTIPNLSMNGNRVSDVVSGHWVPSIALSVCVTHRLSFESTTNACLGGAANASGAYSVDFTGSFNVRGSDYASATYLSGSDGFNITLNFPYMTVRGADPAIDGGLNRGQVATFTLETAGSAVRGSATVQGNYGGYFNGYFMTSSGNVVLPRATNKVVGSFASDATVTIPDITVSGVAGTDVVTGHCLPNRPYQLYARKLNNTDYVWRYGTTNGSGNFTQDLTADINVTNGDPMQLYCMYLTGDRIYKDGTITS